MKTKHLHAITVVFSLLVVGTQPALGTKYIPSDSSIGDWDPVNRIYTLTTDVSETIQIEEDNLTFNGAGHTVTGIHNGVYLYERTGVVIQNVNVQGSDRGIFIHDSSNITVTGNTANSNNTTGICFKYSSHNTLNNNTASNNRFGIYLFNSSNNTLTGNTANSNNDAGIVLYHPIVGDPYGCSYNTLIGNTANSNNYGGIILSRCNYTTLNSNTANLNNSYGIHLSEASASTLSGNTMSGNAYNFDVRGSSDSDFDHNIDTTNTVEGKPVYYLVNSTGGVYDSSTNAGVFYAINCANIVIKDLTLATNNYCGVFLWNTHESRIENVLTSDSDYGINLYDSSYNTLADNTASNNEYGIMLHDSSYNTLADNTANSNNITGISLGGSSNCKLTNNIASNNERGIHLGSSSYSTLTGNTMSGNGWNFLVLGSLDPHYNNNIDTSNTVDGKPIYYVNNTVGQIYDSLTAGDAGIFYAINCDNITVKDLTLDNEGTGVYFWNTHNSTIENLLVSNNHFGISLWMSSNNTLIDNTTSNNYGGLYMVQSSHNTLVGNTVSNNVLGIGFISLSNSNQIYNNNFVDNRGQVRFQGPCYDNVFNLTKPIGGNYWSDWTSPDADDDGFVDNPYFFNYGQDNLPWAEPDGWLIKTPEEQIQLLILDVMDLNLQQGIENGLDAKLDAAFQALDDLNEHNNVAAVNALQAFINAVEAQRGTKISDADADDLIDAANEIITLLNEL